MSAKVAINNGVGRWVYYIVTSKAPGGWGIYFETTMAPEKLQKSQIPKINMKTKESGGGTGFTKDIETGEVGKFNTRLKVNTLEKGKDDGGD